MKRILLFALLFMATMPVFSEPYTPKKMSSLRIVEAFTQYETDKFPKSFRTYPFQRGKAEQVYIVREENGNRYLSAKDDKDISVQIFKKFSWEADRWPHFSWKWRAITLPKGAAEKSRRHP